MKNVTVTLPESVARWARIEAAKNDQSVSRFISEMLQERMEQEQRYNESMSSFFAGEPADISGGSRYPSRDNIHAR